MSQICVHHYPDRQPHLISSCRVRQQEQLSSTKAMLKHTWSLQPSVL